MKIHQGCIALVVGSLVALLVACGADSPATIDPGAFSGHAVSSVPAVEPDGDHDVHDEVHLTPDEIAELGIEIETAGPGRLAIEVELPGEVHINGDHLVHVTPRIGGVVTRVFASLGDRVERDQLLATLESRELADAKAAYLAASERLVLASATFAREERLWQEKVTSEQDFLDARRARAEARIEQRSSEQKLIALGLARSDLLALRNRHDADLTRYEIRAPLHGTVIEKHIALGEAVASDTNVFVVADLSTVWIDLRVYQKDIGAVRAGHEVRIASNHDQEEGRGTISFVQPIVGEATRTALGRVVMANPDRIWHPGCFVTARSIVDAVEAPVTVPRAALQHVEDEGDVVFVVTADGALAPRPVMLGRSDSERFEVVAGLEPGERFAATGTFALKAELGKAAFGSHVH